MRVCWSSWHLQNPFYQNSLCVSRGRRLAHNAEFVHWTALFSGKEKGWSWSVSSVWGEWSVSEMQFGSITWILVPSPRKFELWVVRLHLFEANLWLLQVSCAEPSLLHSYVFLQIFTYERKWYTRKDLARHRIHGDPDDTSHRGHPLCKFCDERYLDNDELLKHLRRDHYFCHFCDSDGAQEYYRFAEIVLFFFFSFCRLNFRKTVWICESSEKQCLKRLCRKVGYRLFCSLNQQLQ